uniref:UDP-N-acetylglucosamine transferase subunit ALG14 n=1 Tax=Schistocephalus solidus TaxID=70667 RepID=A0A0X3PQ45_SCHSO
MFFLVLFSGLFFILAALLWVIVYVRNKENELKCCTLLVLGSGGHTAELLSFAGGLSAAYSPRVYVIAKTDQISEKKARCVEAERTKSARQPADFFVETLPRAREVGQSYVTSVFTTLIALLASIRVVLKHCPQLFPERHRNCLSQDEASLLEVLPNTGPEVSAGTVPSEEEPSVREALRSWAMRSTTPLVHLTSPLEIMRRLTSDVPSDSRTQLGGVSNSPTVIAIGSGECDSPFPRSPLSSPLGSRDGR